MGKQIKLTNTDFLAIEKEDGNYFSIKGNSLCKQGLYEEAIEFYRLAAAMGNSHSINRLGNFYLFGDGTKANISVSIGYFKMAAIKENIDSCIKLGEIYSTDRWGLKDNEMSIYYYRLGASAIIGGEWNVHNVIWCSNLQKYPHLSFAIGKEFFKGKNLDKDLVLSYIFLRHAFEGYLSIFPNEEEDYHKYLDDVVELLANDEFDSIRDEIEEEFSFAYSGDEEFNELEEDEEETPTN